MVKFNAVITVFVPLIFLEDAVHCFKAYHSVSDLNAHRASRKDFFCSSIRMTQLDPATLSRTEPRIAFEISLRKPMGRSAY